MYYRNRLEDLKAFFSCEGRPVTGGEFWRFWNSLSDEEIEYYRMVPLD